VVLKRYYIDTCIWLNLFKKEGDAERGVPYWEIADKFINNIKESEQGDVIVSTIVLKELTFKLKESFNKKRSFFKEKPYIIIVKMIAEDILLARKIESENNYQIGFCDCLHIAIAKRLDATLVTRDKDLIIIGRRYVYVDKPENLIC